MQLSSSTTTAIIHVHTPALPLPRIKRAFDRERLTRPTAAVIVLGTGGEGGRGLAALSASEPLAEGSRRPVVRYLAAGSAEMLRAATNATSRRGDTRTAALHSALKRYTTV